MDDNTLKQLWSGTDQQLKIEINMEKLIGSINQKIANMNNVIKRRDRIEILVAIGMIALFGWWFIVTPIALVKIGSAIILAGCVLVIFKLINAKRIGVKQDNSSDIKHHLNISLLVVRKQIALLNTIVWWYLLPFFIGVVCLFFGSVKSLASLGIYIVTVAVLYGYIWYLNKQSVKKYLKPLEEKLTSILEELSRKE